MDPGAFRFRIGPFRSIHPAETDRVTGQIKHPLRPRGHIHVEPKRFPVHGWNRAKVHIQTIKNKASEK